MARHPGKPHRAEEDRVELPELVEAVLGHHAAGLRVNLAAPVEDRPLELEAEPPAGRLEDPNALGHDLLADPITRNHCYAVSHAVPPCLRRRGSGRRMQTRIIFNCNRCTTQARLESLPYRSGDAGEIHVVQPGAVAPPLGRRPEGKP